MNTHTPSAAYATNATNGVDVAKCDLAVLPPSFYDQSLLLGLVQRKAHHVMTGPDAVLAACLARVAAAISPSVTADYNDCPLGIFAAIIGPPGAGKSKATTAARRLLPSIGIDADWLPVPTGEGLCDLYLGPPDKETNERPIVKRTAFVCIDEGQQLHKTAAREGATVMDVARSLWAAQPAGNNPANPNLRRNLPADSVRLAMVVNYQPDVALQLFRGAGVGDPQRFVIVSCLSPYADRVRPPDVPALDWRPDNTPRRLSVPTEVAAVISDHEWQVATGRREVDPLDVHDIQNQLRIATVLALFHNPHATRIESANWNQAAAIMELTRENRRRLAEYERAKGAEVDAEKLSRQIDHDRKKRRARTDDERVEKLRRTIVGKVMGNREPIPRGKLTRAAGRERHLLDRAISEAVAAGQIIETPSPNGQGHHYTAPT